MNNGPPLIFGHLGQDGTILRRSLAFRGVECVGVSRGHVEYFNSEGQLFRRRRRPALVSEVLRDVAPSEIYYLAASHSSSEGNLNEALDMSSYCSYFSENVNPYLELLESASEIAPKARIFFAASSKVFSPDSGDFLDETSPLSPETFYGMAKAQALWLSRKYRSSRSLFVTVGTLFNHESSLRPESFLSARVIKAALNIKSGGLEPLVIRSLGDSVDWSLAAEFVEGMQLVLRASEPDDFLFCSGRKNTVQEFVEEVFSELEIETKGNVRVLEGKNTPRRKALGLGTNQKVFRATGWRPTESFSDFVRALVQEHLSDSPLVH